MGFDEQLGARIRVVLAAPRSQRDCCSQNERPLGLSQTLALLGLNLEQCAVALHACPIGGGSRVVRVSAMRPARRSEK